MSASESSAGTPAPEAWVALRTWERSLDRGTRERGADYADGDNVQKLLIESDRITGIVSGGGSMPYRTSLRYNARSDTWMAVCDCPVGVSCKHAVATALLALRRHAPVEAEGDAPARGVSRGDAFILTAIDALGRDLTKKESLTLRNICEAAEDLAAGRAGMRALEGALIGLAGYAYTLLPAISAELHTAKPDGPGSLFAALALALESRNIPMPAWARRILAAADATGEVRRLRDDRAVAEWCAILSGFSDDTPVAPVAEPEPATHELRLLRESFAVFTWQTRPHADAPWSPLTSDEKRRLLAVAEDASPRYTPPCRPVVELFRKRAGGGGSQATRIDALNSRWEAQHLADILIAPVMRGHVVTPDGAPVPLGGGKLVWQFIPSPDGRTARPVLARSDGSPVGAELLPLGRRLALTPDGIHPAPAPLGNYDGTGTPPDIPAAVFADDRVRKRLESAGARIVTRGEITTVALTPLITCTLHHAGAHATGIATFALHGEDAQRRIRSSLTKSGWVAKPVAGEPASAIPDTASLDRARLQFARSESSLPLFPESIDAIATWLAGFPAETRFDLPRELAALTLPPDTAELAAELTEAGRDWFDLRLVLKPSDAELTPAEVKLLMSAHGRWVKLPDKGWRRMQARISDAARDDLATLGLNAHNHTAGESLRLHAAQLAGDKASRLLDDASRDRVRRAADRLSAFAPPPLPAGLKASLRPYQHDGFHFLAHLSANGLGGILADDMGLGKTLQTLAWLLWLKQSRPAESARFRALVVAPKSVTGNWVAECAKFAPGLKVAVHGGDHHARVAAADLVVVNYTRMRLASESFLATEWTAVVLDEGQHIKNPASQVAETARALKAEHRLVLSGTPVENRLLDLWSLYAFAMPGLLGTHASFKRHYDEKKDPGAAARLATRVRPFLLRRTKSQVAPDLPARIEEDLVVELEPAQRKLYDAELRRARALLLKTKTAREFDQSRFNILSSLLRLRQICCDPRLVSPKAKPGDSAKLDALWELLEPLVQEGHKVLVFSQFTEVLDLIGQKLADESTPFLKLTGATENRAALVARFQEPDTEKVFLLSLKAAGTGLNLTAASYVVLFDPWWNPAAEAQAVDRTHRIGQKNKVIAYRLLAKNSVEEKIRALQRDKGALAADILQEESLAKVLDIDTLRDILAE